MNIDQNDTAVVFIDPQNDSESEIENSSAKALQPHLQKDRAMDDPVRRCATPSNTDEKIAELLN